MGLVNESVSSTSVSFWRMASAFASVQKWVSPWITAIIRSCSSGVVRVIVAPWSRKIERSPSRVAGSHLAGVATIV